MPPTPISLGAPYEPQRSTVKTNTQTTDGHNRNARLAKSKLVFHAARDAMILGDEEEAARLWALWYHLIESEAG